MKLAVFRADASIEIASGHVQRCLTLADALKALGFETRFVSRQLPGHLFDVIRQRGHSLTPLPAIGRHAPGLARSDSTVDLPVPWEVDALDTELALRSSGQRCDWLIVDHYGLGRGWERKLRVRAERILVIDDLATEAHDCDALLNECFWPGMEEEYDALIPRVARRLLGPRFALVRPVFRRARDRRSRGRERVGRILISYGGVDATGETGKALEALARLRGADLQLDVVVGTANPRQPTLQAATDRLAGVTLHIQLPHLADLMSEADLALSAGGSTLSELLCVGVPTLVTTTAQNQVRAVRTLSDRGVVRWLGSAEDVSVDAVLRAVANALARPEDLRSLSEAGHTLIDCRGAERCAEALAELAGPTAA